MRIVLVSASYDGYLSAVAPELAQRVELHLVLDEKTAARIGSVPGASVHTFGRRRARHPLSFVEAAATMRRIRRIGPDVVHVQMPGHPVLQPLLARGWHGDAPLVVTVHDPVPHRGDRDQYPLGDRTMQGLVRAARRVIVLADVLVGPTVDRFGVDPERLAVVAHPAIDLGGAVDPGLPDGATVLFFGRRWAYKGLDVLAAAMPEVVNRVPGARLVVAGTGAALADSIPGRRPAWLDVHDHYVEADTARRLFAAARVVALPYREASQSGVAALAVGMGRPMVASRVGGLPEMVGDGGLLVEPGHVASLADALTVLLTDDERWHACADALRQNSASELSASVAAERHVAVYRGART